MFTNYLINWQGFLLIFQFVLWFIYNYLLSMHKYKPYYVYISKLPLCGPNHGGYLNEGEPQALKYYIYSHTCTAHSET